MKVLRAWKRARSGQADPVGGVRPLAMILPLVAIMVVLSACTFQGPTMTIDYKSPENKELWSLYSLTLWLAVAVWVVVTTMLLYAVIRYRRRPGQPLPRQIHGNNRLEIGWTLVPAFLLLIIAVPTVQVIISRATPAPSDALQVRVIGHQFWWEVRYPDPSDPNNRDRDLVTANEIHVPVGRTVQFSLTSGDVQHSFWIPLLGGKMDLYPNRTNYLKYTPLEVGKYYGQCSELCGTAHAFMKMYLFADTQADYDTWFAAQKGQPSPTANGSAGSDLVKQGQRLVLGANCVTCHYIEGTNARGRVGPDLTHFGSRTTFAGAWVENNEANIKAWVHDPSTLKPGVTTYALNQVGNGGLISRMPAYPNYSDAELTAIAQYLLSLK
jgi:cytochrome c oxidase subunit 2